ncbi:hypothetical protein IU474_05185 [Nocardia otitidiscaviarum]|uniref:hypothetical protein n=1 Tax=Nocardia otitidiscaviarum TaxID=1823 RepID=UPI0018949C30|nr:hypothetical protein [Nocardia otitidiscaviarum]MBF6236473.1 hypothetical protein [Nocardia otitidiscaviarum]
MRYQHQSHTHGVIGGALALAMLTAACGSSEPADNASAKQPSQTTCAEFMRMSEADQWAIVQKAAAGQPGWEIRPDWQLTPENTDEPPMELRAATTLVKRNCDQPDAADKTVADSVYIPLVTTTPTP